MHARIDDNAPMASSHASPQTLVDDFLLEQRDLTAVARFARWHAREASEPAMARHYSALIPLSAPSAGQQYGFEVDLDACSGCKACVTACHALNGLEEHETWRRVGLLVSDASSLSRPTLEPRGQYSAPHSLLQHVTTACHHCLEPACLHGCPVLAYDKDPMTGIVRHLDDQCIGCTYCVMMCPYEVPRFSARLGIVRKCDLCHGRLAAGEAPACVQACPTEAIRIGHVEISDIRRVHLDFPVTGEQHANEPPSTFPPASPNPTLTLPTTRYLTRNPHLAFARAADEDQLAPAPVHRSLVGFLLLSQLSVGLATAAALHSAISKITSPRAWIAAWLIQWLAMGVAFLHLGQPLRAWRAFLGWRTSWFSREVIAFAVHTLVLGITAGTTALGKHSIPLELVTALTGHSAVFCSAMIYAATGRRFWALAPTTFRFYGTTAALGAPALLFFVEIPAHSHPMLSAFSIAGLVATLVGERLAELGVPSPARASRVANGQSRRGLWSRAFSGTSSRSMHAPREKPRELRRTSRLLRTSLVDQHRWRWVASIIALHALLALATGAPPAVALAVLAMAGTAACMERQLFFSAVAPDRMPGGVVA
jgi:Fe-S-cluster-containing dehydrogenase component/DMSO reductase anchor subunit